MHENDEASELTRRRFIQFSSMAGATILTGASILAGAGHALSAPSPTCGPDPDENDCGNPHSKEPLWTKSQDCFKKGTCLQNHPDFVVMKGNPSKKKYVNYLLIPTKRINGIECPWICCSTAPNYWSAADYCATQQPTEVPAPVGLGINSRPARQLDQLHIHMARARPESYNDLVAQDKLAARTVENWADTRVSITGYSEQHHTNIQHTYRVLIWGGFTHDNLFAMLRSMLVHTPHGGTIAKAQAIMYLQTLIVIPRPFGGYYIVNSERSLEKPGTSKADGSDTCDPLLLMHP
ncbi:CDP-diacylglycerol diphosphatase [Microbispora hainanensis]|jgi:CDP-diacylglycerol pyrophosphatase|uniref:CDP-diacylglycerol diphosphatase n=1 Tax=Microbispora TaxID=2005 RepID=UPI0011570337|nr:MULTISPECIES: CDP-diacylglycerol diphosphatase [Microbispora]NJP27435.1 twin-arginine translocation signal domain-containing protein [Microbispora sp. CL1-1]TQS11239.1 twin-arginine translocation signal domain-containing protein [Microbispora sp. SCL1-1]